MSCCPTDRAGVTSDYEAKGAMTKIGELDCYVNLVEGSEKVAIVVYDIFGLSAQAKQVCDQVRALS